MTQAEKLTQLKNQLENLYNEMPSSFFQMQQRDKSAFLLTREIEKLENQKSYNENIKHWENYELRF